MSYQELKEQVIKLSVSDRLALISAIAESLQLSIDTSEDSKQRMLSERSRAIQQMMGLLKTDKPTPTDEDVALMLEERRIEKYLQ